MADTSYEKVVEQTHRLAESMSRAEKSASGVQSVFGSLFRQLVGAEVLGNVIRDTVRNSRVVLTVQQALTGESLNKLRLTEREIDLNAKLAELEAQKNNSTGKHVELVDRRLAHLRSELSLLQKQKVVNEELEKLSRLELSFMTAMAAAAGSMWFNARQFNQSLIEANASWQHRDRLIQHTLVAQAQLGISFDEITKSAAALVHYGMDTEATFETNLRLVSQMEQGLGVSVDQSAQLASIVERQVRGSFERVSHVIAQIVNDTALAGDEAARLAVNISTAMGRLRPGISAAGLPEVVRLVGRYESALKEVGGQSGAFQQLLTQLTTPEGLAGAGALGVNPEFLATSRGVEAVMNRFAKYGEMLVGQSQGWERQMRLQALAQIFSVTTDQANQMLIAIKRAQTAQGTAISTQERWREQLSATNSGIARLGNALMGLLQGAMYPVIFVAGALANRLADVVGWMLKSKEVVYAVGGALFIGTVVLTTRLWGLVRALTAVALSSRVAQAALTKQAALNAVSGWQIPAWMKLAPVGGRSAQLMLPGFGPTTGMTFSGRLASWFPTFASGWSTLVSGIVRIGSILRGVLGALGALSGVGLLIAGIAVVGGIAYKLWSETKRLREESAVAQQIILTNRDKLASQRQVKIYQAARYSDDPTAALLTQYELRLQEIIANDLSWAEKRQQMTVAQKELEEDVLKARVTRGMYVPLSERTPQEQAVDKELRDVNGKVLGVNEKMEKHMLQRIRMEMERRQEDLDEAAKARLDHLPPSGRERMLY